MYYMRSNRRGRFPVYGNAGQPHKENPNTECLNDFSKRWHIMEYLQTSKPHLHLLTNQFTLLSRGQSPPIRKKKNMDINGCPTALYTVQRCELMYNNTKNNNKQTKKQQKKKKQNKKKQVKTVQTCACCVDLGHVPVFSLASKVNYGRYLIILHSCEYSAQNQLRGVLGQ